MKKIIQSLLLASILAFSATAISQTSFKTIDVLQSRKAIEALKDGKTLGSSAELINYFASDGSIIWLANSKYQNDIAGIGRDDHSNYYQKKSKSTNNDAIVRMKIYNKEKTNKHNSISINNLAFLSWGNNNNTLETSTKEIPSSEVIERINREWKVINSGIDWVSISFSLSNINYSGTHISDFELLISNGDGDFTKSNIQRIKADSMNASTVYFNKISFKSGQVFTLATNIEHKPEIISAHDFTINAESNYNKTFSTKDLDADAVSSMASKTPSWLSFTDNKNGTFTLKGKPSYSDIGLNKFIVKLNDNKQTIEYPITFTVLKPTKNNKQYLNGQSTITTSSRLKNQFDDVEEQPDGQIFSNSSDLEMSFDGWLKQNGNQTIGLRFSKLNIPQGAIITSAFIQFTSNNENTGTGISNITIEGEASDNSTQFAINKYNVSKRERTSSKVLWSPAEWTSAFEAGSKQKTTDLKNIVQEIVSRPGYNTNSAISFIITGTGNRTAQSQKANNGSQAPHLTVEYIIPTLSMK